MVAIQTHVHVMWVFVKPSTSVEKLKLLGTPMKESKVFKLSEASRLKPIAKGPGKCKAAAKSSKSKAPPKDGVLAKNPPTPPPKMKVY